MTRNAEHSIEVGQYPKSEAFPNLEPGWWANLTFEPHADADVDQGVQLIFTKSFTTEQEARKWAEMLDLLLAYSAMRITRTYQL